MKQEEKELLLKDLCARLPYRVKVKIKNEIAVLDSICDDDGYYFNFLNDNKEGITIEDLKPYLFPLSSMTNEQKKFFDDKNIECNWWEIVSKEGSRYQSCYTDIEEWIEVVDWLNKNHFDYRGLIPMELAIDATGLNVY